jgi:hypothetical protein
MRDDAEQVERIGLAGLSGKHPAVTSLGLCKTAGLMMAKTVV